MILLYYIILVQVDIVVRYDGKKLEDTTSHTKKITVQYQLEFPQQN